MSQSRCWRDRAALAVVVALIAAAYLPMLLRGKRLAENEDFLQNAARHEFLRRSVFEHGVFPLRSHYFGSGYPTLGEPEDPALNPLAWFLLPWDTVLALKLRLFLGALAAGVGTFLLARGPLGHSAWGAAFAALTFALAAWLPWQVESGNMNEFYPAFVPLCLFLILTAPRHPLRFVWLPLLFYTILSDGKQCLFAVLLFMAIVCTSWAVFPPSGSSGNNGLRVRLLPLFYLALAVFATLLISMARILPALEVLAQRGGLRQLDLATHTAPTPFPTPRDLINGLIGLRDVQVGVHIYHVGLLPLLLFLGAFATSWRKAAAWAVAVVILVWLALGPQAPLNLLAVLNRLPIYSTFDRPGKYLAPFVALAIAMGAAGFLDALWRVRSRWLAHLLAAAATTGTACTLAPEVVRMSTLPFSLADDSFVAEEADEFYSVAGAGLARERAQPWNANAYFNLRRNVGTIDWYTALPLPAHGQPRFFVARDGREQSNPDYRGEAYFLQDDNRCTARFSPNRILVEVEVRQPGLLVLNQNFHPGWSANRGRVKAHQGLLAVELSGIGNYGVVLRYTSSAFIRGAWLSLAGVLLVVGFIALWRRGRLTVLTAGPLPAEEAARPAMSAWPLALLILVGLLVSNVSKAFANWDAFHQLAAADRLRRQAEYARAEAAYRRVLSVPTARCADIYHKLGFCAEKQGNLQAALEYYRQALLWQPRHADACNNLGAVLGHMRRFAEAREYLERAVALDPRNALAWYNLGLCRNALGDAAGARVAYRRAIDLRPDYAEAHKNLAVLLAQAGEYAAALSHARRAVELRPDDADARANLAHLREILHQIGE